MRYWIQVQYNDGGTFVHDTSPKPLFPSGGNLRALLWRKLGTPWVEAPMGAGSFTIPKITFDGKEYRDLMLILGTDDFHRPNRATLILHKEDVKLWVAMARDIGNPFKLGHGLDEDLEIASLGMFMPLSISVAELLERGRYEDGGTEVIQEEIPPPPESSMPYELFLVQFGRLSVDIETALTRADMIGFKPADYRDLLSAQVHVTHPLHFPDRTIALPKTLWEDTPCHGTMCNKVLSLDRGNEGRSRTIGYRHLYSFNAALVERVLMRLK